MQAYIVIPCLNEEQSLEATCTSLGFGEEASTDVTDTTLVLVDNGSCDQTVEVMQRICRQAPSGKVVIAHEPNRGFVPPRSLGIGVSAALAAKDGLYDTNILIVQADADTIYQLGYVRALLTAAESEGPQIMLEGCTKAPSEFVADHPEYEALCARSSASIRELCVPEADEVIIDDKVCAFRLADYSAWGGHKREYDQYGEEIHAETSRLYLRTRTYGARKLVVSHAVAEPSRRKIFEGPAQYFVTAGYPFGAAWSARWRETYTGDHSFDRMRASSHDLREEIFLRQAHEFILFGLLPAWVARILGAQTIPNDLFIKLLPMLNFLPASSIDELRSAPGRVLQAALKLMDTHQSEIRRFLMIHAKPI